MHRWSYAIAGWVVVMTLASVAQSQEPAAGDFLPPPAPEQPIAFSHRTHVAQGLACTGCHAGAESADRATLPPTATCMACHQSVRTDSADVQKLAGFHAKPEDVPWRRVYRVPNYVTFSHRVHIAADKAITCETCHGNVRELTTMQKLRDTSMASCMSCHASRAAPNTCDTCHEPR